MKARMSAVSIVLVLVLGLSVTIVPAAAAPPAKVFVTNSNDSGPGSFRAAINQANDLGDLDTADLFTEISRGID